MSQSTMANLRGAARNCVPRLAVARPRYQAKKPRYMLTTARVIISGRPPAPSDAMILPGIQSGLSTAFRALVGAGRPLLMESPTYWGAILAAERAGVQVVPVPSGIHGPDPAELAARSSRPEHASSTRSRTSPTRLARSGRRPSPMKCSTWCASTGRS
ncbi:hypothetical protein [Saccharopolyspora sp. NPDC002376]